MQHLLNSATERQDLSLQPITQRKERSLLRIGVAAAVALLFAIALPKSEAGLLRVVPTRAVRAPVAMYSFSPYPGVVRPNPVAQTIAVQQATVRAMLYQEAIRRRYFYLHFYVLPRLNGALSPYPSIGGSGEGNGNDGGN
jgi:hypothetical protein